MQRVHSTATNPESEYHRVKNTIHPRRFSTFRSLSALAAGVGLLILTACAPPAPVPVPSDDTATPAVTVKVIDNSYEPAAVTIRAGEAVRWDFVGVDRHDVVSDDRSFVTKLQYEGSYTHVFTTAGEYAYLCSIHPEMRGVVTVK